MSIPLGIIANADDLGLNQSVNQAILYCFDHGYINSTSFLTNTVYFEETVDLIHKNPSIQNIGVHVNLAEGKPVSRFDHYYYLDKDGNWDFEKLNKKINFSNKEVRVSILREIFAQIEKALSNKIPINHLDSHCHLHTMPHFYSLFVEAARHYKLKLRLAQTYYEGNILNFSYRKVINSLLKLSDNNYSDYFENVDFFLKRKSTPANKVIEIMLHPDFNPQGELTDHVDDMATTEWIKYLTQARQPN